MIAEHRIAEQRTEDRRTEGREQRTEDRGQKTEDRGQKTEDRRQKTEDRKQRKDRTSNVQSTGGGLLALNVHHRATQRTEHRTLNVQHRMKKMNDSAVGASIAINAAIPARPVPNLICSRNPEF